MKLVTWVVALCNRKWQDEFAMLVSNIESEKEVKPVPKVKKEPNSIEDDFEFKIKALKQQPTHLSRRFRARPKRKKYNTSPKPSAKEEALREVMDEEFKRMAEGR